LLYLSHMAANRVTFHWALPVVMQPLIDKLSRISIWWGEMGVDVGAQSYQEVHGIALHRSGHMENICGMSFVLCLFRASIPRSCSEPGFHTRRPRHQVLMLSHSKHGLMYLLRAGRLVGGGIVLPSREFLTDPDAAQRF